MIFILCQTVSEEEILNLGNFPEEENKKIEKTDSANKEEFYKIKDTNQEETQNDKSSSYKFSDSDDKTIIENKQESFKREISKNKNYEKEQVKTDKTEFENEEKFLGTIDEFDEFNNENQEAVDGETELEEIESSIGKTEEQVVNFTEKEELSLSYNTEEEMKIEQEISKTAQQKFSKENNNIEKSLIEENLETNLNKEIEVKKKNSEDKEKEEESYNLLTYSIAFVIIIFILFLSFRFITKQNSNLNPEDDFDLTKIYNQNDNNFIYVNIAFRENKRTDNKVSKITFNFKKSKKTVMVFADNLKLSEEDEKKHSKTKMDNVFFKIQKQRIFDGYEEDFKNQLEQKNKINEAFNKGIFVEFEMQNAQEEVDKEKFFVSSIDENKANFLFFLAKKIKEIEKNKYSELLNEDELKIKFYEKTVDIEDK